MSSVKLNSLILLNIWNILIRVFLATTPTLHQKDQQKSEPTQPSPPEDTKQLLVSDLWLFIQTFYTKNYSVYLVNIIYSRRLRWLVLNNGLLSRPMYLKFRMPCIVKCTELCSLHTTLSNLIKMFIHADLQSSTCFTYIQ